MREMLPNLSALRIDVQLPDDLTREVISKVRDATKLKQWDVELTVMQNTASFSVDIAFDERSFDFFTRYAQLPGQQRLVEQWLYYKLSSMFSTISLKLIPNRRVAVLKFQSPVVANPTANPAYFFVQLFDALQPYLEDVLKYYQDWASGDRLQLSDISAFEKGKSVKGKLRLFGNYLEDGKPRYYRASVVHVRPDTELGMKRMLLSKADPGGPVDVL